MQQGQAFPIIQEHRADRHASIVLAIAALFLCGLPTVFIGALCAQYIGGERTRREVFAYIVASVAGGILTTTQLETLLALQHGVLEAVTSQFASMLAPATVIRLNPIPDYLMYCLLTLPLAGLLGGAMDVFKRLRHALRLSNTVEEWQAITEEFEERRRQALEQTARDHAAAEPERSAHQLTIGTKLHGESLPHTKRDDIGIHQRRNVIVLDEQLLDEHMFVLGATGAGKSTYLLRLCTEVLKNTTRDLIVIDGKGEEALAQDIRALVWKYRGHETPIFRMGGAQPGAPYNPFHGEPTAIYNRLLAMVRVSAAEGNAEFYADTNRDLLSLVCLAPGGPPRSLQELRERLTMKWLHDTYDADADERRYIATFSEKRVEGLLVRVLPFVREMREHLRPDGFGLEEVNCAIFSIRALSVGDTAQRFCRFLIEDVKDYVASRANRDRGGLLCIDEFGVFGNDNISAVLSQARSKRYGVVLATQDYSNLGEERLAQGILSNTLTKVLMGTDYPEALGAVAGTRLQVESSIQSDEMGPTGMMSGRIQHAFKVDMNVVRRFQRGQSFVIRKGYAVAVQISPVTIEQEERNALPSEHAPLVHVPIESTPEANDRPVDTAPDTSHQEPKRRRGSRKL